MNQSLPRRRIRAGLRQPLIMDQGTQDAITAFGTAMMMHGIGDSFQNVAARTGFGTDNLLEGTNYPLTRLSRNFILIQALYRSNWIARKIIDCVAEDMMKNWVRLDLDLDPAKIKRFDTDLRATGTRARLLDAIKWGRLFGGAIAVMMIKGHENKLLKPLDLDDIGPGTYRGLLVMDRWSVSPGANVNYDLDNPQEFDLPETYRVNTDGGKTLEVHASRCLRFCGRGLPHWERQAENRWGISEYEIVFDEIKKRDNTSWNIASLIFRANIMAMKQKDLSMMLSGLGANQRTAQNFWTTLQAQTHLMSSQGLMILPEDGGLETHQYGFTGIAEVYQQFMLDICGASELSMSKLFGRSSSGLAGTNEGDEHNHAENIKQKQERDLDPVLLKLLPVVAMSSWGKVPKDFDWKFNPVRTLSNEEQSELASKKGTLLVETFNSGILGRKTTLMELKAMTDETGMFSNITDEMIEEADDEPMMGDMGMEMGGDSLTAKPGKAEEGLKPEKKPKKKKKKKAQDAFFDELIPTPDDEDVAQDFEESKHPRNPDGEFTEWETTSAPELTAVGEPHPHAGKSVKHPTTGNLSDPEAKLKAEALIKTAISGGKEAGIKRGREYLRSRSLGRDFGESSEDFEKRNPAIPQLRNWLKSWEAK